MLKKIISGGKAGADRAALDVAIRFGIPHGGWISKDNRKDDVGLPDKYQLEEMLTKSRSSAIAHNVLQSDGTLIISRGPLEGDITLARQLAVHHGRPWLHININKTFISDSIKILEGLHTRWIVLLKSLSEDDLKKEFIHPDYSKRISLGVNISLYAWHSNHHLEHIKQALRYRGVFQ